MPPDEQRRGGEHRPGGGRLAGGEEQAAGVVDPEEVFGESPDAVPGNEGEEQGAGGQAPAAQHSRNPNSMSTDTKSYRAGWWTAWPTGAVHGDALSAPVHR